MNTRDLLHKFIDDLYDRQSDDVKDTVSQALDVLQQAEDENEQFELESTIMESLFFCDCEDDEYSDDVDGDFDEFDMTWEEVD